MDLEPRTPSIERAVSVGTPLMIPTWIHRSSFALRERGEDPMWSATCIPGAAYRTRTYAFEHGHDPLLCACWSMCRRYTLGPARYAAHRSRVAHQGFKGESMHSMQLRARQVGQVSLASCYNTPRHTIDHYHNAHQPLQNPLTCLQTVLTSARQYGVPNDTPLISCTEDCTNNGDIPIRPCEWQRHAGGTHIQGSRPTCTITCEQQCLRQVVSLV